MLFSDFARRAVTVPFLECGRDWSGWDCWGLVYVAYRELFGIDIPTLSGEYDANVSFAELNAIVDVQKQQWNEVRTPRFGDISLFRVSRFQSHVALIAERGQMLHCSQSVDTISEPCDSLIWAKRHVGYFRHEQRFSSGGNPSAKD